MAEKALTAAVREAYVQGVSARSVDDLVQVMGMTGICKSHREAIRRRQARRRRARQPPCVEIDDKIETFLNRPLEGDWPYVWLDAICVQVRQTGRILPVAVIIATGVNADGQREVLGMDIGPSEAETFWTEFLRKLARRGLRGVKVIISDAHEGLKAAITKVLHATGQRCRVHLMRNLLAHAGKHGRGVVAAFIATAFAQEDAARSQWRQVADQLRPKVPTLAAMMDEVEVDALAYMGIPKDHRPKLHSTSQSNASTPRSSGEPMSHGSGFARPRAGSGIFPNEAAIVRLVGTILLGTERRMGRAARPLHDTGSHGRFERRSYRQAARRGGLRRPADPAGDRDIAVALTPRDNAVLAADRLAAHE